MKHINLADAPLDLPAAALGRYVLACLLAGLALGGCPAEHDNMLDRPHDGPPGGTTPDGTGGATSGGVMDTTTTGTLGTPEAGSTGEVAGDGGRADAATGAPDAAPDAGQGPGPDLEAALDDAAAQDATSAPDAQPDAAPEADAQPQLDAGTNGDAYLPIDAGAAEPSIYDDDARWLCRPALPNSLCAGPLEVTDVHPDGSTSVSPLPETPADARADCFYLYPTVDPGLLGPRNLDFDEIDMAAVRDIASAQIVPFREVCNVYAPVYRQASLSAIDEGGVDAAEMDFAYQDVEAAFDWFLRDADAGRPILLIVHSQGARHTTRLLEERVEGHPALMGRLVVAILAGPLGGFSVAEGQVAGGSLDEIPLCTDEEQTGCVLTFNTYSELNPPGDQYGSVYGIDMTGRDLGCTTPPAGKAGEAARLTGAVFYLENHLGFPLNLVAPSFDFGRGVRADTPYARYADFYTARCARADVGLSYLRLAADPLAGDVRVDPVPYDSLSLSDPNTGLHALDYAFVSGDLLEAAKVKLEAHLR